MTEDVPASTSSGRGRDQVYNGKAVFLDRDGVINALVARPEGSFESPLKPEEVVLLPGAAAQVRRLRDAGLKVGCVTNQPSAAKGSTTVQEVLAVHQRVLQLLHAGGASFDAVRICQHHPHGVVPELSGTCSCRKPAPGMLVSIATELHIDLSSSWVVGDTDADIGAGRAVGAATILVETPGSEHKRLAPNEADVVVPALEAAVDYILHELSGAAEPVGASR